MLGALLLAGCATTIGAAPPPGCEIRLPAARPGTAPLAVLRDVAGGASEYLIGSPGGELRVISSATGFGTPQLGGSALFFSVRHGQALSIFRGSPGGCAHHLAEGTLGAVEPRGRALTALVGAHWVMLNADGKQLARLTGAAGSWTADGRLVEPAVGGIDLYSLDGRMRSVPLTGVSPLSPLGRSQELLFTATGTQVMDLDSGARTALNLGGQQTVRAAAGSPDGAYVAYLDVSGAGRVLELGSGQTRDLAAPSFPTGFSWSRDSRWVALQSVYGGVALEVHTGRVIDTGSLVVVNW